MAAHARLKNEFMVDEKYHNLMSWLKYSAKRIPNYFCIINLLEIFKMKGVCKNLFKNIACQTLTDKRDKITGPLKFHTDE